MAISRFNIPTDLHVSGNVGAVVTGSIYATNTVSASSLTSSGPALINGITFTQGYNGSILNVGIGDPDTFLLAGPEAGNNVALGFNVAGYFLTGGNNTFIGDGAGNFIEKGEYNTFIGAGAGNTIVTGNYNVALGEYALGYAVTGNYNVAIGPEALYNLADTQEYSSSYNVAIGPNAGANLYSGHGNVLLGGYDGGDIEGTNNNVVISDGDGNVRIFSNGNGNVRIGDVDPTNISAKLEIIGNVSASEFSGSGAGLTNIPANSIVGLNLAQIATGSITASVSQTDSQIFKIVSGSTQLLRLDNTGSLSVNSINVDTITAREFYTQYVSSSIIYESGSTLFGDTDDDIHQFTGSLQVSGALLTYNTANQATNAQIKDVRIINNLEIGGALVNNPNGIGSTAVELAAGLGIQTTASAYNTRYVSSKLVLTAETAGGGHNQVSEVVIIRNNNASIVKLTPYAVTYTSNMPMVEYDAQYNSDNSTIEIIATNKTTDTLELTTQSIYMITTQ